MKYNEIIMGGRMNEGDSWAPHTASLVARRRPTVTNKSQAMLLSVLRIHPKTELVFLNDHWRRVLI